MQKDPFWLFWVFKTILQVLGNDVRNFEINKIRYKVLLRIDSAEIFYGGDRMRQGLSFEVLQCIYSQCGKIIFTDLMVKIGNHFIFQKLIYIILIFSGKSPFQKTFPKKVLYINSVLKNEMVPDFNHLINENYFSTLGVHT